MVKKFKLKVSTNRVGSEVVREVSVDDAEDFTDADIEQIMFEEMIQHIRWNYEEIV